VNHRVQLPRLAAFFLFATAARSYCEERKVDTSPHAVYDVVAYGAAVDGVTDVSGAVNAATSAIRSEGAGILWFPATTSRRWKFDTSLLADDIPYLVIDGVPGTVLYASTRLDGSDQRLRNDLIYALNFSGTAPPDGHKCKLFRVTENITLDASLQSPSGVPPAAYGTLGFNLCTVEAMNIQRIELLCNHIGGYGNGPVASTQDPRVTAPSIDTFAVTGRGTGYSVGDILSLEGGSCFTKATFQVTAVNDPGAVTGLSIVSRGIYVTHPTGDAATSTIGSGSGCTISVTTKSVKNAIERAIIKGHIDKTCRGPLPTYRSTTYPSGICGSAWQIGAAVNVDVDVHVTNVGGPAGDFFNVEDGRINVVCDSIQDTPVGANIGAGTITQQPIGVLHSDFGAKRLRITGRAAGLDLKGAMQSGLGYFFNGGVATPGPLDCTFDFTVDADIALLQITPQAIGESGATYANNRSQPLKIVVTDGAGVGLEVQRGSIGPFAAATSGPGGTYFVAGGDSFKLTYTSAPTWKWYLAPNAYQPGVVMTAGSLAGAPGRCGGHTGIIRVKNSNLEGVSLYDVSGCADLTLQVDNPGLWPGSYYAVRLYDPQNQAGGGCRANRFRIRTSDSRGVMYHNLKDDGSPRHTDNAIEAVDVAATSISSISLTSPYTTK
jgi:hypothetical protein